LAPFRSAGRKVSSWPRGAVVAALLVALASARAEAQCTGCPNPSLHGAARAVSIGNAGDLTIADFDRDGIPDVAAVTSNQFGQAELAVLRGTPTGNLAAPTFYPLNTYSGTFSSSAGDFDGDGNPDVVAARGDSTFFLSRGNGNATFAGAIAVAGSQYVYKITSGDFNGDGKRDVAYTDDYYSGNTIWIRLGDGSGGFLPAAGVLVGSGIRDIAVADFNRDGLDDLVSANGYLDSVSVILGAPAGFSAPARNFDVGNSPIAVTAGDFNRDGKPDLAVTNYEHGVTVLVGDGGGGFENPTYPGSGQSGDIAAGDFNGDGNPDIVSVGNPGAISFFAGDGKGGFASPVNAGSAGILAPADFNRDGITDLATLVPGVAILLGTSSGKFFDSYALGGAGTPLVGDFDADGRTDVVSGDGFSLIPLWNDPAGFSPGASTETVNSAFPAAAADFNGDGRTDAILLTKFQSPGDHVVVYLAVPGRTFVQAGAFAVGDVPEVVVPVDLNGDSKVDLVVANYNSASISVLLGTGSGTFTPQVQYAVGTSPNWLAVEDFNRDNKPDVAILRTDGVIVILLGDGAGSFVSVSTAAGGAGPAGFASGDFNEDGKPDLATINMNGQFLSFLPGNGMGGFGSASSVALPDYGSSLTPGDVNGDSHIDLLVQWGVSGGDGATVFLGNGAGGFARSSSYFVGFGSPVFTPGDFEGDGLVDFAVATNNFGDSTTLLFLRNTNCSARRLGLTTDVPGCVTPGVTFAPQPVAKVYDDGENLLTCDAGTVSASILPGTGTPGAVLNGTTSVNAVGGIATFTNLSVNAAGAGYRLKFAHAQAGTTLSRSFSQGLTVMVTGPGQVCSNGVHEYDAGAGYETYQWTLDGNPLSRARKVTLSGLSAGSHTLAVTVTRDGCMVSTSRMIQSTGVPSAVVTGPTEVCPYKADNVASVPDAGVGATYVWTVTNGVITAGAGTRQVTFTVGPSGMAVLSVTVTNAGGCSSGGGKTVVVNAGMACPGPVGFFTITPCRVIDTRQLAGPYGGPSLSPLGTRNVTVAGQCGIPTTAKSVVINVIVTNPGALGYLVLYPGNTPAPLASTINFRAGQTRANNGIVPLGAAGDVAVSSGSAGSLDFLLDVNGYFE